ncbi:MAG: UxaA family hydrolase [Anaerolineaceae bacterium]|nr:MAG: UxaA family hydrolase [Anaerolineaceae bacterium]
MTIQVFVIDESDNVATNVADEIPQGTMVDVMGTAIETKDLIPYGHKMAIQAIPKGGTVLKYALSIGSATEDIQPGNHVHVHNVESNRGRGDLAAQE